jgi:hypothetical protein
MIMHDDHIAEPPIPRWLRFVLTSDRAGSSWYIGAGFLFAPVLALVSPWPPVTAVLWGIIALAGLWLGLLGIAMAVGLARVLRSGAEIPEEFWRSIVKYQRGARGHERQDSRGHGLAGAKVGQPAPQKSRNE